MERDVGAFTYNQVRQELKLNTNNYKQDIIAIYSFDSEFEFALKIARTHYQYVDYYVDNDGWHLFASNNIKFGVEIDGWKYDHPSK